MSIHRPFVGRVTDEGVGLVDVLRAIGINSAAGLGVCTRVRVMCPLGKYTFVTPTPFRYMYPKPASPVPSFCEIES